VVKLINARVHDAIASETGREQSRDKVMPLRIAAILFWPIRSRFM
jgi:hypothetical protein